MQNNPLSSEHKLKPSPISLSRFTTHPQPFPGIFRGKLSSFLPRTFPEFDVSTTMENQYIRASPSTKRKGENNKMRKMYYTSLDCDPRFIGCHNKRSHMRIFRSPRLIYPELSGSDELNFGRTETNFLRLENKRRHAVTYLLLNYCLEYRETLGYLFGYKFV